MTKVYFETLEHLVCKGFYLDMGEWFRVVLRFLVRHHGLEFKNEEAEE